MIEGLLKLPISKIKESLSNVIIAGGGPAGLMAAETLARAGLAVTVYEQKPSVGRKFLMAGRGGLNLTHSEQLEAFLPRYGNAAPVMENVIDAFPPDALRAWCEGLGQPTFVGSSGRVFPQSFKASPMLRAWLARLEGLGVRILTQRCWQGWDDQGRLVFTGPDDARETARPAAILLALGGASWPRLGSDGFWTAILERHHIPIAPLRAANCGFTVGWSPFFSERFAGQPVKPVILSAGSVAVQGEMIVTATGLEGGAIYALSRALREQIEARGQAVLTADLRPGLDVQALEKRLQKPRARQSFSSYLRRAAGVSPVAIGLLREADKAQDLQALSPAQLAARIKATPIRLTGTSPIDRAISTAGGIALDAVDDRFMLKAMPGVFAAGEMLDWEAPTGGYLLQGCFGTGVAAARGIIDWLAEASL